MAKRKKRTYYRFRLLTEGERLDGLVRREEGDEGGSVFAHVGDDGWVIDQALFGYLTDPGDIELVEIPEDEALTVARSYGVELEGEAA